MMRLLSYAMAMACLSGLVSAAKEQRTFAVLHFNDHEIVRCREDPIISPGKVSGHVHSVMGGSNFGMNATGEDLLKSDCSNAKVKGDFSNYWFPSLYYHNIDNNTFEAVPLFYVNVYYFFEPTSDPIKPFPVGLQMVIGNPSLRTPPASRGDLNQDPSKGPVNGIQCTCPRPNPNPPSWPAGSDGSMAGIQDTQNLDAGTGFPFHECDAFASPMRWDAHFPSCYNPDVPLNDYKNNMVFPSSVPGTPYSNCPAGWVHTPHIFFEVYWNTLLYQDRWNHNGTWQPFVFSTGDCTGFGSHADALMAWDQDLLQNIIDNCNAGDSGMENCPGLKGLNTETCTTTCSVEEQVDGTMDQLPGHNPLSGWYCGAPPAEAPAPAAPVAAAPVPASPVDTPVVVLAAAVSTSSSSSLSTTSSTSTTVSSESPAMPSPEPPATPTPEPPAMPTPEPPATPTPELPAVSTPEPVALPTPATSPPAQSVKENSPASADASVDSVSTSTTDPITTTTSLSTSVTTLTTSVHVSFASCAAAPVSVKTVTDFVTLTVTSEIPGPTAHSLVALTNINPNVNGWAYQGCYGDTPARVLTGNKMPSLGPMSNTKCVGFCSKAGYKYAGTEYGSQCFCGDSFTATKLPDSAADIPCEDAPAEFCGGHWSMTIYSANNGTVLPSRKMRRNVAR